MKTLIIGLPRSGTSLVCHLLTINREGVVFGDTDLDTIFPRTLNKQGYFQYKSLYYFFVNSCVSHFDRNRLDKNYIRKNLKHIVIDSIPSHINYLKDPYLLYVLPEYVRATTVKNLIVVVRNPNDTVSSLNNFKKTITGKSVSYYTLATWCNYYLDVIRTCRDLDVPIEIINYDRLDETFADTTCVVESSSRKEERRIGGGHIKYLYSFLCTCNGNMKTFNETLYQKIKDLKPNDRCLVCNSGKKYKKCCAYTSSIV